MKRLFLFPMMAGLLLAGCHPDDGVDLPEPQKPVSELILGNWEFSTASWIEYDTAGNIARQGTAYPDDIYIIDANEILIPAPPPDYHDARGGEYTLTKSAGKNYIEFYEKFDGYAKYEITAISDTKMTWVMNDSLAALSDIYSTDTYPNGYYAKREFTKK